MAPIQYFITRFSAKLMNAPIIIGFLNLKQRTEFSKMAQNSEYCTPPNITVTTINKAQPMTIHHIQLLIYVYTIQSRGIPLISQHREVPIQSEVFSNRFEISVYISDVMYIGDSSNYLSKASPCFIFWQAILGNYIIKQLASWAILKDKQQNVICTTI